MPLAIIQMDSGKCTASSIRFRLLMSVSIRMVGENSSLGLTGDTKTLAQAIEPSRVTQPLSGNIRKTDHLDVNESGLKACR